MLPLTLMAMLKFADTELPEPEENERSSLSRSEDLGASFAYDVGLSANHWTTYLSDAKNTSGKVHDLAHKTSLVLATRPDA
jgi:hypothetical protein